MISNSYDQSYTTQFKLRSLILIVSYKIIDGVTMKLSYETNTVGFIQFPIAFFDSARKFNQNQFPIAFGGIKHRLISAALNSHSG